MICYGRVKNMQLLLRVFITGEATYLPGVSATEVHRVTHGLCDTLRESDTVPLWGAVSPSLK